MATKRAPPKDLDISSMQSKQPRFETLSQSSLLDTHPISSPSHGNKSSSLSRTELHGSASTPISPLTPKVTNSPTHVIGVPTGRSPGMAANFEVDAAYVLPITPTQKPLNITTALQLDSNAAPLFVAPVSVKQQISVAQSQFVHSGLTKPSIVPASSVDSPNTFMALSSDAFVTLPMSNPPPYNAACNVSGIIATHMESEPLPCTNTTSELSCSSPSQLLQLPISSSSSRLSSSTLSPTLLSMNRQPVCLIESINGKDGPKKDKKTMKYRVLKHRRAKLASLKLKHEVDLKEKFFLETGGNMMDIVTWKKRPNIKRDKYLKLYDIESEASPYDQYVLSPDFDKSPIHSDIEPTIKCEGIAHKHNKHSKQQKAKLEGAEGASVTSTTIQIPLSTVSRSLHAVTPSLPIKTPQLPTSSPRSVTRLHSSFSSLYETSHEDIVMRARHEAEVMRAIGELRKEGLWSSSRLPKVQEPLRKKTHWDYLLEEMQWLATDFANERRWKINAAKKISRSISGYYRELEMQQVRTEKEEALKLKKIAFSIAKEIKHFWDSIQKVVAHKQQLLLEEKRKRAMDMHLEFIVDQTAKYSNWLVKGLAATSSTATPSEPSLHSTAASIEDSDAFLTPEETSDDEETIEKEEQLMEREDEKPNYATEIKTLQEEGEMPLDQLLASLPPELLKKDWMETGEEEVKEEVMFSGIEEKESDVKRNETTVEVDETELQKNITDVENGKDHDSCVDGKDGGINSAVQDELTSIQALSVMTDDQKVSEKKEYEDESLNESMDEGSLSSEDSGDEGDSEASCGDEEKEGAESLEYLVSGKRIEEVCQTEAGFSDVAAVAEQFQPKGITLATTEVKTNVPFLLKHLLREYQHIGLDWLVAMHEKRLNGILADEMGLGKTIQTIALLAHLACEEGNWGPHLIVVPTSVMLNWECELKKWCPAFKLLTYFGSFKERKQKRVGWTKRNAFHVCITSYNIAVTDHRAFKQMKWKYLVLDEAQNIKNFKSQRWQTLLAFNSQRRLLLTGTPLQNNLMELWSLMHFLMPTVFSSHSDFREWFSNPLTGMVEGSQEYNESIVKRLHQVLRPFLLRRLKMEVEKQMPKKYEHVIMCRLSKRQRFLYDEYLSRRKTKDTLAAGNYLSVINILMQLRKVCNHPDLFEPRPILSPLRLTALEFYTASLLFTVYEHDPFKHVCLDHLNLQLASYELDTEAFAAFRSRQLQAPKALICDPTRSQVDMGEEKDEEEQERNTCLFLEDLQLPYLAYSRQEWSLSRRRYIHEVNSRRCRRIPMYGIDLVKAVRNMSEVSSQQAISPLPWSTFHWLWSGYMACKRQGMCTLGWEESSFVLQALLPTYEGRASTQKEILKRFIITVPPVTAPSITLHTFLYTPAHLSHNSVLTERIARHLAPQSSIFHCISTSMSLQFPETRLIQYDCGKLQTLDVLLRNLKAENHRVLIFTQMARVLDILEIFLNYHGHTYLRLDGATPVQKRQVLMDQFNRDGRIFCFILSTRSGGLGVNLTGADTVVFYDSDWNPTMDAQAQDRCHRIGQTRDVHIYRLVCESTVEENILKKANQKRMLGDIAIEGGVFTTDFFREATLRDLFKVKSDTQLSVQSHPAFDPQTEVSSLSSKHIEDLLMQAEDENDAQAASMAKAEQMAEKAEFDEDFCAQVDRECISERHPGLECSSKALTEFATVEHQLSGVERYAMRYLEEQNAEVAAEQLKIAEESIEQAKKSWELSHMQSLREEEERIAEEDAEDDVLLSYDRPELANKVILRRHSSTGMWEVCSPSKSSQHNKETKIAVNFMDTDSHDSEGSDSKEQPHEPYLVNLPSRGEHSSCEADIEKAYGMPNVSFEDQILKERSPSSLQFHSHTVRLKEQQYHKAGKEKNLEPNYNLLFERTNDGDSSINCSPTSKRKTIDRDFKLPRVCLSPGLAYTCLLPRSQSSDDLVYSDQLLENSTSKPQSDCIGFRTRQRAKNRVITSSGSSVSSPPQSHEGSTIFIDKGTGEEMPVWLPPTPPVDDGDELYVDIMLDMAYDTSSIITPAELASIAPFSEEDYDVLGLSRRYLETEPNKKPQKSTSKQVLKEHVNVPPSLFWRRYATDTLSTKLKKLASHQKKLKAKDQFSPLLEQQPEGPEWSHYEDWLLLKGITEVLEFPLSLAITVPAQMPNWSIIADLISLLSQVRRSPLQCREHLMNVVIPREDSSVKGDDSLESKKHKSNKDGVSKKLKSRKEQKIKHTMVSDGGKEQTKLFTTSFEKILETASKRKQTTKFSLDSVQKPSIHADLLKDYGIGMDSVLSPMQIAHRRAERIQSEPPRSSQVHQLLAQPYHFSLMRGYAAAAAAAGAPFMKSSSTGYNLPRQVSTSIAISTAPTQRFQPVSSASTSFTSSQLPQVTTTTIPSPVLPTVSQATPLSSTTSQQSAPMPLVRSTKAQLPAKTFNMPSVSDISKTLRGNITHQLLLRQNTLQQQANANHSQSSAPLTRPLIAQQQTTPSVPTPSSSVTQKVALPSGIEQLRGSIALPTQPRFGSVGGGRGLAAGRTLQTEDVLALLKQQSLRIAATQSYKAGHAVPSQLHPQTHFQFRSEPGHSATKVQVPTAVVPPEGIKLVSTSNTTAMSVTDTAQAQQKVEGVEQNQGSITTKQFSAAPTTAAINIPFGSQQPSSSVITTAAQNLVKAQIQQVLAQQQLKTQHGSQLPKTTSQ